MKTGDKRQKKGDGGGLLSERERTTISEYAIREKRVCVYLV